MHYGSRGWITQYALIGELEEALRERVSDARGSPFIAHCDVPLGLEEAAVEELVNRVGGSLHSFFRLMSKFPCVCTRVIATALAESYGKRGRNVVYRLIARCLELGEDIPLHQRRSLHDKFRDCCEVIGLALPPVSTDGRMVDAYLFQAGVSQNQLPNLALAFLRAERLLGLPPSDDTREVDDWEDRAAGLAPPGHRVLRRIVREDPTGYHATAFLRLRRSSSSPTSNFEHAFRQAIQTAAESPSGAESALDLGPSVQFEQGDLWVTIPRRAHRLEVKIGGKVYPLSRGRRLALPLPWAPTIEWRRPSAGDHSWGQLQLFGHGRRILIFDGDTGLLKGSLDPALPNGQRVRAGQLCLVSQSAFEVNEEPCHRLGDEAFVLFCDISTGMMFRQRNLQCEVKVEARLRLEVVGKRIVGNRDGWLLAGPIALHIHGRRGDSADTLEVRVRHPAFDGELICPVRGTSDDRLAAELDMPVTGDFGLARASLHIQGQNRALYRTRFWYWPGLEQLKDERLFIAESVPSNLAEEQLAHIARDRRGRLVVLDGEAYLRARICFWVDRRLVGFSLPPPGASVSVRRADGTERPLRVGASIAVRDDYASSLIVRYSDPAAAIDLKGQMIPTAFGKTGSWRVSFAQLKEEGEHNRIRLLSERELSSGRDLVRIVPEAEPKRFWTERHDRFWFLYADLARPIEAVRLEAENLVWGEKLEADLTVAFPRDYTNDSPLVAAVSQTDNSNQLHITIDQNNFGDGIWFVGFQVREVGREDWLPLVNSSGESYAICIASTVFTRKLASRNISAWCPEAKRADAFIRLSQVIEMPIARPCRSTVLDLALDAWRRLGNALDACNARDRASLLRASALPPSPHARESWIPVHHPVEVSPNLFAVPAEDIGELESSEAPGYEDFESIGLAGLTESLQDAVDVLDVSTTFLIAFEKASALQRDPEACPGAFDFSGYCLFARTMKDIVEDNKPLSVWHHDRACERMADRIVIASRSRFSSNRLLKAATVVHHFARHRNEALDAPEDLAEGFTMVEDAPHLIAALTRAWRTGDAGRFWLELASLVNWPTERVRKHVGTVLRLAPELLAFYLLLWVLVERHETA